MQGVVKWKAWCQTHTVGRLDAESESPARAPPVDARALTSSCVLRCTTFRGGVGSARGGLSIQGHMGAAEYRRKNREGPGDGVGEGSRLGETPTEG